MNPTVKAFAQLIKFRLTASVAATSVFGYILGCKLNADGDWKSLFDWVTFSGVLIGGMLVVFASNGLNQIIEKENDGKMTRTAQRPIVEERISLSQAITFCWITGILGIVILSFTTPFVAVFLSGLSLVIYVFVYTLFKFKNSVTFGKSHLTIKDTVTNKKTEIHFDFIDNLLLEKYIYRTVFTALIITTKSGTKYRILNFFVWNFKDLRQELALLKKRKTGLQIINKTNTIADELF